MADTGDLKSPVGNDVPVQVGSVALISGCSSVGRARALGAWGRRIITCHSDQPERACRIFHSHYSQLSGNRAVWHSKLGRLRGLAKRIRQWNLTPRPQVRFLHPRFICGYGVTGSHADFRCPCRKAWGIVPLYPYHGHRMVAYRLLNSFDHYYSQLASDGAVVLCKLGFHAAVVQRLVHQPSKLRTWVRLPSAALNQGAGT